jgi:hypothetical protein
MSADSAMEISLPAVIAGERADLPLGAGGQGQDRTVNFRFSVDLRK